MNNENTETVKSVSAGSIVLWILGVLTIVTGIGLGNIAVIIAGIILLPIINVLAKKHLKINFSGMARVVIAILLIVVGTAVASSLGEVADDQSEAVAPQEEVWTEVFALKGKGNQDSESFAVTGKKVRITATTCCGSTAVGTYSGVSLEKENGGYTGPGLSISTDGAEEGEGQTTYRNLEPGRYYIQVITGVSWDVKVEETN